MPMKSEIFRPIVYTTLYGLLFVPLMIAAMWVIHTLIYIISVGNIMVYDVAPLPLLKAYLRPDILEYFGLMSLLSGGAYGLLGAMASFRTYQLLACYCRRNGVNFRELSYLNKDQLADAYSSLSILDDGNYVFERDAIYYFVDRLGYNGAGECVEIPFDVFHRVRIGKYETAHIRAKYKKQKWSQWGPFDLSIEANKKIWPDAVF